MVQGQNREVIERIGFYDVTHAYLWDKSDYSTIREIYDFIRAADKINDFRQKREHISVFENLLERVRNDQTAIAEVGLLDNHHTWKPEPLDVIEKEDRVTNSGRTRAAELIAGEAGNRFDYAAVGTSQTPVSDADSQLYAEVAGGRINIRLSGYASASGAIIKHSGLWTPGLESNTYWEFAPVDRAAYHVLQMIWARVVFPPNKGLVHVQNEDFFTVTHSTYTSSLA